MLPSRAGRSEAQNATTRILYGTSSIHFHQEFTRSSITISNPTTSISTQHPPSSFHTQCLESNLIPYTLRHTLRSTIRRAQSMNSDPAKHVDPARTIGPVYDPCALDSSAPAAGPPRSALHARTARRTRVQVSMRLLQACNEEAGARRRGGKGGKRARVRTGTKRWCTIGPYYSQFSRPP